MRKPFFSGLLALGAAFYQAPAGAQTPGFIGGTASFASFDVTSGTLGPLLPYSNPYAGQFAVTADGSKLYVPSGAQKSSTNQISVVSTATGAVLGTIAIPALVRKVILSADQSTLWVMAYAANFFKVDLSSGAVAASPNFHNQIADIALSPDESSLYVALDPHNLYAFNTSDFSVKWSVSQISSGPLTVSQDGNSLYVSYGSIGPGPNFVTVVDTATHAVGYITVPNSLIYVAVPPTGTSALAFSVGESESFTTPSNFFTANFMNTVKNQLGGTYISPPITGLVPAYLGYGAMFVPIQFDASGGTIWMLATCADTRSTQCSTGEWQLEGFAYPGGTTIANTPLPASMNVIAIPH